MTTKPTNQPGTEMVDNSAHALVDPVAFERQAQAIRVMAEMLGPHRLPEVVDRCGELARSGAKVHDLPATATLVLTVPTSDGEPPRDLEHWTDIAEAITDMTQATVVILTEGVRLEALQDALERIAEKDESE